MNYSDELLIEFLKYVNVDAKEIIDYSIKYPPEGYSINIAFKNVTEGLSGRNNFSLDLLNEFIQKHRNDKIEKLL